MTQRMELAKDYTISRVLNGCWQLSKGHSLQGSLDLKDVMKAFHMLVEQGFTTFDCADIYTGAEEFISRTAMAFPLTISRYIRNMCRILIT